MPGDSLKMYKEIIVNILKLFQLLTLIARIFFKFFIFNLSLCFASEEYQPKMLRDESDKLVTVTKEALKKLGNKKSFINYDLNLTNSEIKTLKKISINSEYKDYNNFGNLEKLEKEVSSFIILLGNNEEISKNSALLISRIVNETVRA